MIPTGADLTSSASIGTIRTVVWSRFVSLRNLTKSPESWGSWISVHETRRLLEGHVIRHFDRSIGIRDHVLSHVPFVVKTSVRRVVAVSDILGLLAADAVVARMLQQDDSHTVANLPFASGFGVRAA